MRYLLTALLLVPALVSAQELHTFKNGEVADAEKVNENFAFLASKTTAFAQAGDKLFFENGFSWIATGYRGNESGGEISIELGSGKALLDGKYFDLQITSKYYPNLASGADHILCSSGNNYPREITMIFSSLEGYVVFQSNNVVDSMTPSNENASLYCSDGSQTTYVEVVASAGAFKCASGFLKRRIASYAQTDLGTWIGQPATPTSAPIVQGIFDGASSGVTTDKESYLEIPTQCP